ncbi:SDR family oxidoreductase [Sphingomicrobium flavum]|uniref:SDR family oxidoreductase n=1 Tax=Sphingomicrobium flavum TaxID=1229164 RepID=UPI0021ADC25F|nr:SDR family oxidoreductase [Sphingomicrobium flavum]
MSNRFEGKKVLITGGTNGIGLATAARIAKESGKVAVTGTSEKSLDRARQHLPDDAVLLVNDAGDPAAAKELARIMKDEFGELDAIYLNAGYGGQTPVGETSAEEFDQMMSVNVRGPVLQMNELAGLVKDGGSILMTSSVAPHLGMPAGSVYAATKACNAAMARNWARDMAPRNVRVNAVAPGPIATAFGERYAEESNLTNDDMAAFFERIKTTVPLARMGTADEAAAVSCFLLSDDASYVTGSEYMVDGGMTMR